MGFAHYAAEHMDGAAVQALARAGVDLGQADRIGVTPLHVAAVHGNVAFAAALLDFKKVLAKSKTVHGADALYLAAENGRADMVSLLAARGLRPNAVITSGMSCLMVAIFKGHADVAQQLIALAPPSPALPEQGDTALHLATAMGQHATIEALLASGVDVEATRRDGLTALHVGAKAGDAVACAAILRHAQAGEAATLTVRRGRVQRLLDAAGADGFTPLHIAARQGHADIASLLVEHGADASKVASNGGVVLEMALANGHVDCAAQLLSATKRSCGPEVLAKCATVAIQRGYFSLAGQMARRRFPMDSKDARGRGLAHHLCMHGQYLRLEKCIDSGVITRAQLDEVDASGRTPLGLAIEYGQALAIDLLQTKYGAKQVGTLPSTVAAYAARYGCLDLLHDAIETQGGDVEGLAQRETCPERGKSLAYLAAENGQLAALQFLLARGAKLEYTADGTQYHLMVAVVQGGSIESVQALARRVEDLQQVRDGQGRGPRTDRSAIRWARGGCSLCSGWASTVM